MTVKLDLRWLEPVSVLFSAFFCANLGFFQWNMHTVYVVHDDSTSLCHMYGWCGCQLALKVKIDANWLEELEVHAWRLDLNCIRSSVFQYQNEGNLSIWRQLNILCPSCYVIAVNYNIAKSFYVSLCSVEVQIATNIQGLEEWLFNYQCTSC